jgi:DNA repair protein RecO (recombination protein O)
MPTHEAEAVILRQYLLSEADRIIVLLTREVGLLRAVARGARKPKSRLGACLEPLNHVRLQYFMKEGGELSRVFQCEMIHSYLGRNPSLDQVYGFTYFAELAQEFSQENNPNPTAFRLLLATLNAGEKLGVGAALLRYFELWLLRLSGLLPNYDYCSGCGKCVKEESFYVWPETGQVHCQDCAHERGLRIGWEASGLLRRMLTVSPEQFASTPFPDRAAAEVEHLSERLLDLHLEKKLKSRRALQRVLEGG